MSVKTVIFLSLVLDLFGGMKEYIQLVNSY